MFCGVALWLAPNKNTQPSAITALHWDVTSMRLFSGDLMGVVAQSRVGRDLDTAPTKRRISSMFQSAVRSVKEELFSSKAASDKLLAEGSAIVQVVHHCGCMLSLSLSRTHSHTSGQPALCLRFLAAGRSRDRQGDATAAVLLHDEGCYN